MFAFGFTPKGWTLYRSQLLPINQNQALFALLSTMYNNDKQITFALPNLQNQKPMHLDADTNYPQKSINSELAHTLTAAKMPTHTHAVRTRPAPTVLTASPTKTLWAQSAKTAFSKKSPTTSIAPSALSNTKNSQPHDNMPPYTMISFAIALQNIFPSYT